MVGLVDHALVTLLLALNPSPPTHPCQSSHIHFGSQDSDKKLHSLQCHRSFRHSKLPRAHLPRMMADDNGGPVVEEGRSAVDLLKEAIGPKKKRGIPTDELPVFTGLRILELGKDARHFEIWDDPSNVTLILPPANRIFDQAPIWKVAEKYGTPLTLVTDQPLDVIRLPREYYDVGFCMNMLDGAPEEIIRATLIVFWRALKPNGQLYFMSPTSTKLTRFLKQSGFEPEFETKEGFVAGVAKRLDQVEPRLGSAKGNKALKKALKPAAGFGQSTTPKKAVKAENAFKVGDQVKALCDEPDWKPRGLKKGDVGEVVSSGLTNGEYEIQFDGVKGSLSPTNMRLVSKAKVAKVNAALAPPEPPKPPPPPPPPAPAETKVVEAPAKRKAVEPQTFAAKAEEKKVDEAPTRMTPREKLVVLKKGLESGLLTQEEHDAKRAEVLSML